MTMTYYFCTYFDHRYSTRGLALYDSLREKADIHLYILCLDSLAFQIVGDIASGRSDLTAVPLDELEKHFPELLEAKANRSLIEYYFTLSPALPLFVLERYQQVDVITYLDADLFFYDSPAMIYQELGNHSILMTEHRFTPCLRDLERYGRYNVQYQSFRRDEQGLACLKRWKEQCQLWCYDRIEGDRYADQKYLDEWPERYPDLVISRIPGVGVAPWNIAGVKLELTDTGFLVNGGPLVFYHFHSLRNLMWHWFTTNFAAYKASVRQDNVATLYRQYVWRLDNVARNYGVSPYHRLSTGIRIQNSNWLATLVHGYKGNLISIKPTGR